MARYDVTTTTLATLLEDPEVVAIMEQTVPGMTSNPMIAMVSALPADQAVAMAGGMIGPEAVSAITDAVTALE